MFQQDGATCYTSKKTISAIDEIGLSVIAPNIWPPNSPDLSPLDFFFLEWSGKSFEKQKVSEQEWIGWKNQGNNSRNSDKNDPRFDR